MQFMVFAVPIIEQAPAPGQVQRSISTRSSSPISPATRLPMNSLILDRVSLLPLYSPCFMAPACTNIAGMSSLAAAISMPGVVLSQLERKTAASNWCA